MKNLKENTNHTQVSKNYHIFSTAVEEWRFAVYNIIEKENLKKEYYDKLCLINENHYVKLKTIIMNKLTFFLLVMKFTIL